MGFMLVSFPSSVQDSESKFSNQGEKKKNFFAITPLSAYTLLAFIAVAMCGKLQRAQMGSDTPLF